jgi:hypothetical protein
MPSDCVSKERPMTSRDESALRVHESAPDAFVNGPAKFVLARYQAPVPESNVSVKITAAWAMLVNPNKPTQIVAIANLEKLRAWPRTKFRMKDFLVTTTTQMMNAIVEELS